VIETELTRQQQLREAYTSFFKTRDGAAFTHSFGKSIPSSNGWYRPGGNGEAAIDFCDPCTLPQSSVIDHPLDHVEPAEEFAPLDGLNPADVKTAVAIFEASMRWCIDGQDLVHKGLRSSIVISALRPDLGAGLKIDRQAARIFRAANASANGSLELTGRLFGASLEWLRRGARVSELGERITVLCYILRPDLIDKSTLAELANLSKKTRQAHDKLANSLRDTFRGLKARTQRGESTRIRCRNSRARRTPQESF
jgi:hypothetical protein